MSIINLPQAKTVLALLIGSCENKYEVADKIGTRESDLELASIIFSIHKNKNASNADIIFALSRLTTGYSVDDLQNPFVLNIIKEDYLSLLLKETKAIIAA